MKLIIEKDEQAMSESAMHIVLGAMMQDKRVNISLTGGRSPKTMYQMMIPKIKDNDTYKDIQYYLFDENPYTNGQIGPNWQDLQDLFFKDANIPDERIHIMDNDNYLEFDNQIKQVGGIDVMVIGLGQDGHFCGNCPRCTPFDSYTYSIPFPKKQAVNPTYKDRPYQPATLTMGPKSLMRVNHLVMIVNGKEKAEILKRFLDEPINQDVPATILKMHPNLTVIADQDAASLIHKEDYIKL
ncbi:glucosamine-6-phosphate deaminase [Tannockella kyphosi]|uniref:glucosamine-6-phosphate deaminase n=1 Tax=Tannockella kyphosi TaxID=2899121 RepID=UPI002011FDE7|nr:glucosamine-6-phosphate deaminase [Tannockella kyphosi]